MVEVPVLEHEARRQVEVFREGVGLPKYAFREIDRDGLEGRCAHELAVSPQRCGVRDPHPDDLCDTRESRELDVLHPGKPRHGSIPDADCGLHSCDGGQSELGGCFLQHVGVRLSISIEDSDDPLRVFSEAT